jgi:hypothetical protein
MDMPQLVHGFAWRIARSGPNITRQQLEYNKAQALAPPTSTAERVQDACAQRLAFKAYCWSFTPTHTYVNTIRPAPETSRYSVLLSIAFKHDLGCESPGILHSRHSYGCQRCKLLRFCRNMPEYMLIGTPLLLLAVHRMI